MESRSDWQFKVVKDEFFLYFPEGDYDIDTLVDWYRTIPTRPDTVAYYGDNINLLKQHFEKFAAFSEIRTKSTNDFHSNPVLYVWCMAIYNWEMELVGFAAQELINDESANKKIRYFGELRE